MYFPWFLMCHCLLFLCKFPNTSEGSEECQDPQALRTSLSPCYHQEPWRTSTGMGLPEDPWSALGAGLSTTMAFLFVVKFWNILKIFLLPNQIHHQVFFSAFPGIKIVKFLSFSLKKKSAFLPFSANISVPDSTISFWNMLMEILCPCKEIISPWMSTLLFPVFTICFPGTHCILKCL